MENKKDEPIISKKVIFILLIYVVFVVVLIGAFYAVSDHSKNLNIKPQVSKELHIGDTGYLTSSDGTVLLGTTKDDYRQLRKLLFAKDAEGILQMTLTGEAILADSGTEVRIIDTDVLLDVGVVVKQIRFLDGKYYGQSGWMPDEFIQVQR